MRKLTLEEAIELYDKGSVTFEGVYDACETDLEFYNFLCNHVGISDVKETMRLVSGADDAYYNALAMAEAEEFYQ